MNKQGMLYTIIFTFIICFAFVFLLSLTNEVTREMVALNETLEQQGAVLSAFGIEYVDEEEVQRLYAEVEEIETEAFIIYSIIVDGQRRYAKQFAGPGLWGTIHGVLAINEAITHTVGIEIVNQNETPGLGARVDESWFKEQFRGETIVDGLIQIPRTGPGDPDHENGRVDGVTGATRTSDSMEAIINRELEILRSTIGGLQ